MTFMNFQKLIRIIGAVILNKDMSCIKPTFEI